MRRNRLVALSCAGMMGCAAMMVGALASGAQAQQTKQGKDIVETAMAAGSFETLVTAIKAAGLVEALKGEGPFTVFAPTDEAFKKLPSGTVEKLLQDKEKLQQILKYHVVPGKVTAAQVVKLDSAKTLQGKTVEIDGKDGVKVNQAKVVKADVMASNGVIHVIDTVLIPKE